MRARVPPLVLVVEDEEPIRRLITESLREDGYVLVPVDSAEAALRELRREDADVDLVVLDIIMPELSGEAVVRQMRDDPRRRDVPVLVVTALARVEDAARLVEAGADAYLTKPFRVQELREVAARLIRDRIRGAGDHSEQ